MIPDYVAPAVTQTITTVFIIEGMKIRNGEHYINAVKVSTKI